MALMLAFALVLAGCGGNNSSNSAASPSASSSGDSASAGAEASPANEGPNYLGNDISQPVELKWYLPVPAVPQDLQLVEDAVNAITKEKINATVKLMMVPFGDYPQKMNTVVASGEEADLIWTANWSFIYLQNVAKGAFAPLDDMLEQYAPDIFKQMPAYMREGVKVQGQTYAVPNYQSMFTNPGFVVQKEYVEKYGLDPASITKIEDMDSFFSKIVEAEKDVVPFGVGKAGYFVAMLPTYGLESLTNTIAAVRHDDPTKVLSWFDLPEYEHYQSVMRDFFKKGYINKDAAMAANTSELSMTGKMITGFGNGLFPGGEAENANAFGGKEVQYITLTDPMVTTNNIQATLNAVSQSSKNKERALMLLNLVNTDSDLFNLLAFGIKDKHHTIEADGTVKINMESGYAINSGWIFGNVFNGYELAGTKGKQEVVKQMNEKSKASPIVGFSFQADAVTSQIANVNNVISQYRPALSTGSIDASEKLEEFRSKLKQAGIDEVIAEMQKQLDAFHASK